MTGSRVLSPTDQAALTLAMCERMGYSLKDASAETVRTLAEQRADPEWRESWEHQRAKGRQAPQPAR